MCTQASKTKIRLNPTEQPDLTLVYNVLQTEFTRALMACVMEKMLTDIPDLLYDDHLLSHFVDETLAFDRELREVYGWPGGQAGCTHILTQDEPFNKWLSIEKKCTYKYIKVYIFIT